MSAEDPDHIDLSPEEIAILLDRARGALDPEDFGKLEKLVRSFLYVTRLLEEKGTTIKRLRDLLFGAKSEKLRSILGLEEEETAEATEMSSPAGGAEAPEAEGPEATAGANQGNQGATKAKAKRKGHGRNGAEEYEGAEQVRIPHPSLEPGDPCPQTGCKGKVYLTEPLVLVRVVGQAPLGATVTRVEQLRCNLCLEIFKARLPEDFDPKKYDESAASMIAILRYGTGVPFNRLEGLQGNLGIPLAASTQWDIVERAAKLVRPAFEELIRQAAQGDVLHNDDTPVKILALMKKKEPKGDDG
jgi:transposase